MLYFFPFLFVFFWSSAFVSGQIIVQSASPFASLSFIFGIVTIGFFLFSLLKKEIIFTKFRYILESITTGVLFHGLYLGGCWYAFSIGMPAAIVALIVTLQPILTNILSGPLFNEKINWKQWLGTTLGFLGSLLVLGIDFENELPLKGILISIVALAAITTGTLWQKKLSGKLSLSVSNGYQAFVNFTTSFILGMTHQILLVSFGSFTILMFLIKAGSVSKTTTLFFLVPPTSAIMAYIFINESLTTVDLIGLFIATFGVYIATRK